jgi:hypothetical protein
MKHFIMLFVVFIGIAITHSFLRADGEVREATKAEQDYSLRVYQTIDKALPAVPAQWTVTEKTEVKPDSFVSVGTGDQPMSVGYSLTAEDSKKLADSEAKMSESVQTYAMAHQDETQKAVDDASPKIDALSKQMEEAIAKGDMSQLESIQKEMMKIQAPMQEKSDAMMRDLSEQREKFKARDARLRISVDVNREYEDVAGFSKENPIASHPVYWRAFSSDDNSDYEGEMMVFAGAWKLALGGDDPHMTTTWNLGLPHTVVQNMVIHLQGDKMRVQKIIESINWVMLNSLFNVK